MSSASDVANELVGFDYPTIRVVVIAHKRLKIKRCRVEENKAFVHKDFSIGFKTSDVGAVWVRVPPRFKYQYVQAILWREGASDAIPWAPPEGVDFIPPLTQKENANFIKRLIAEAKAKGTKLLTNGQFIAIMLGLVIVVGLLIANMAGVTIDTSSLANPTPAPTLPPLPP